MKFHLSVQHVHVAAVFMYKVLPFVWLCLIAYAAFREAAYLNALITGSLASSIARSCNAGTTDAPCSCADLHRRRTEQAEESRENATVRSMWEKKKLSWWLEQDCTDSTDYAHRFTRDFVEGQIDTSKKAGLFALYNSNVGREVGIPRGVQ